MEDRLGRVSLGMRGPFERAGDRETAFGARSIDAPIHSHFGVEDSGRVEAKRAHVFDPQRQVDLDGTVRPAILPVGPEELSARAAAGRLELSERVEADTRLSRLNAPDLADRDRRSGNAEIPLCDLPAELQLLGEVLDLCGLQRQAALVPNREFAVALQDEQSLPALRQEPGAGSVRLEDAFVTPPELPPPGRLSKSRLAESGLGGLRVATAVEGLAVIIRDAHR